MRLSTPVPGLSLIWAMDRNRTIGSGNALPWHLPDDLAYFKQVTMGHTIVMGRVTFEAIGRPLPGRDNVVLTRDQQWTAKGCTVVHRPEDVMERYGGSTLFVIGGAELYRLFLPLASALYVTLIEAEFAGDRHFPELDWSLWQLVLSRTMQQQGERTYTYHHRVYRR